MRLQRSFFASDNTCEICQAGYRSSCIHRELMATSALTRNRAWLHAVYVQEYDGRVRESAEWIGRTDLAATGEIGAAV